MISRAYSTFSLKTADAESRVITGMASTPTADRGGDRMAPAGAKFKLPMPFRFKHGTDIGHVIAAEVTPDGIAITARVLNIPEPGQLKNEIDYAWQSIKHGLAKALSIGWNPIKAIPNKFGGLDVSEWEWLETSAVPIPMNADASILSIKALDHGFLAASGQRQPPSTPGVSGSQRVTSMNASEQLTAEKNALQIKSARFAELMTASESEGGLDEADQAEFQALEKDVPALTAKVNRLAALEAAQASMTTPILESSAMKHAPSPTAQRARVELKELPKGTIFVRAAMAKAAGRGSMSDTIAYAKRFTNTPEVVEYIKATEGVATANSPSWGSELVNPNTAETEFVELLNPRTLIGRITGFRTALFNIPIITQTGASTFEWVNEGGEKPVGELAFSRDTLTFSKCAGIVVMSDELVRLSNPKAEAIVREDLTAQCAKFLDEQFIQLAIAPGSSSPASITYNVSPTPAASGTDEGALLADLNTALATFDDNNSEGLAIVTTPAIARGISLLRTSLGSRSFPEMTPSGGTLLGYPVYVSSSVDAGVVVIFKPADVLLADDGRVTIDASNQATLNMNAGSPGAATFSLWQRNCTALRAERWIKWQKVRESVAIIDTAAYGPSVGSP